MEHIVIGYKQLALHKYERLSYKKTLKQIKSLIKFPIDIDVNHVQYDWNNFYDKKNTTYSRILNSILCERFDIENNRIPKLNCFAICTISHNSGHVCIRIQFYEKSPTELSFHKSLDIRTSLFKNIEMRDFLNEKIYDTASDSINHNPNNRPIRYVDLF